MALNPIKASNTIVEKYLRYIETTFYIKDYDYMSQFKKLLSDRRHFAKGPYLDFSDSFELGANIEELINEDILSAEFKKLYQKQPKLLTRSLYKHQELAIRKLKENKNLVVTTGTGSGKTESFLIPVVNYLMNESEKNTIPDGVRALIIYPMNALANDQMKRMRELFANYPKITFGLYTGETEKDDARALSKYSSLNNGAKPLKNERISRQQIKDSPPHILITNYAMLEYLLLRPDDNVFFHGAHSDKWKYIILDEAHTYTGATGIEVSMLLRRLKHMLRDNEKINFILTSATLGDEKENQEICDFASRLCVDTEFDSSSIVRAHRCAIIPPNDSYHYPIEMYAKLNELIEENALLSKYKELLLEFGIKVSEEETLDELLYNFIYKDGLYYKVRSILENDPATLNSISNALKINNETLVHFVAIASKASNNNVMLLDARYHMFLRALEGAYVTFSPYKELSITPRDKAFFNGEEVKSYKISVCQFCGHIYLEAKNENGILVQKKEYEISGNNDFYMLLTDSEQSHIDIEDEDDSEVSDLEDDKYKLCGKCGKIEKSNVVNSKMCNCGKDYIVQVKEIKRKNKVLNRCHSCGLINTQGSVLRGFYLGQEAAASVIGSSLYEEIPFEETKIIETVIQSDENDDFFGETDVPFVRRDVVNTKLNKQLLVFSDSRQEAAYFSSYFDFTYNNILRRRLFIEALNELGDYADTSGVTITAAVKKLAALFEQHNFIAPEESVKEAWKTVLYEISSNDRNSLENVGLISFEYQGLDVSRLGLYKEKEVLIIQRVLANSFRRDCMFDYPYYKDMLKADKEFFTYKGLECSLSLYDNETKNKYCKPWISKSNNLNSRASYVVKTTGCDQKESNNFLENVWNRVFKMQSDSNGGLIAKKPNEYVMDITKFKIRSSFTHDIEWYICRKCGKLTVNNINNKCPAHNCEGEIQICDFDQDFENNHYRKQFLELDIFPMVVREHTAQLSPETAKKYQEMFIRKEINVLSCSTTFEMGVDVGELETVFMKNMPPSPANYIQRAGRAGRRKDTVAYSLTFCRLSSHDLTYFNTPVKMIRGKIHPPKFKMENDKIVKRHINAAIISSFWKRNKNYFNTVGVFFDDNIYSEFNDYVRNIPVDLASYLTKFVPEGLTGSISNWIKELANEEGQLNREYLQYKSELKELAALREESLNKASKGEKVGEYIRRIDNYTEKIKKENILSFLSTSIALIVS